MYKERECKGKYIFFKPGTPAHSDLSFYDEFNDNIKSIGPCLPDCHEGYRETSNETVAVTLFKHRAHEGETKFTEPLPDHISFLLLLLSLGESSDVLLLPRKCLEVPKHMNSNINSVSFEGPVCIQVYDTWNCSGSSRQLRNGYPHLDALDAWGFDNKIQSLSFCGATCENNDPQIPTPPNKPYITLFGKLDFTGKGLYFW